MKESKGFKGDEVMIPEYVQTKNRAKYLQLLELVVAGQMTNVAIMDELGMGSDTFYRWIKSDEFVKGVALLGQRRFGGLVPKAIKTVEECLGSENSRVRLDAAKLVLDRAFGQSDCPTTLQHVNIQVNYV